MSRHIDNTEDVINSRDVLERIDDLEDLRDMDPDQFDDADELGAVVRGHRWLLLAAAAAASVGLVSLALCSGPSDHSYPAPHATVYTVNPSPHRITEDDPRWDCHTMGNKRCGR